MIGCRVCIASMSPRLARSIQETEPCPQELAVVRDSSASGDASRSRSARRSSSLCEAPAIATWSAPSAVDSACVSPTLGDVLGLSASRTRARGRVEGCRSAQVLASAGEQSRAQRAVASGRRLERRSSTGTAVCVDAERAALHSQVGDRRAPRSPNARASPALARPAAALERRDCLLRHPPRSWASPSAISRSNAVASSGGGCSSSAWSASS